MSYVPPTGLVRPLLLTEHEVRVLRLMLQAREAKQK